MVEEAEASRAVVAEAGLSVERIDILFEFDMHYVGQTHTVSVPLPVSVQNGSTGISASIVNQAFERAYQASFSRLLPGVPAKIVNLRTAAVGRRPHFDLATLAPDASASLERARLGSRPVWFDGGWHDTAIYARLDLPVGAVVRGPAILEQPDATTVIDPDLVARVDDFGNVIVERAA
jgi:N-methylhydantoinase A